MSASGQISWTHVTFSSPKSSGWTCYLFGSKKGGFGMVYTPIEGSVPNSFVRWMMEVCLACRWEKKKS